MIKFKVILIQICLVNIMMINKIKNKDIIIIVMLMILRKLFIKSIIKIMRLMNKLRDKLIIIKKFIKIIKNKI